MTKYPGGRYLVVFDMAEARRVCDFIEQGGDAADLAGHFGHAMSPGFDFGRDLQRVGLANQTTMLSGESLAIADEVRRSMIRRYGEAALAEHFRTFDTICSATQERQDAVMKLCCERAARPDDRGGWVQLQQHHASRGPEPDSRGPDLSHRGRRRRSTWNTADIRHQPGVKQPERSRTTGWRHRATHRHHRRCVDAEQQDR